MAKYTIELRKLVESGYHVFDDTWTTFDPEHKQELCNKILRHYWFYEIGAETADRFKFNINEHLALIMPYYNKLYQSELLEIMPLYDRYLEETEGIDRSKNKKRNMAERMDINALREMAESIKKLTRGTSDLVGNEKLVGNKKWNEDRTIHTTEVTDQDTTEDTTQKVTFEENVKNESNETMHDVNEGTKTTDGTSHTTTSSEKRYSDTPQGQVSTSGVQIENAYLTNYTRESGSSDTTTHEDQVIKNTEDKTTDTTSTKDTTSTQDTDKNVTGTNDVTKTTDTTDNVIGNKDKTQNVDETENVVTTGTEHDFSNGSQSDRSSRTGVTDESEKENEGTTRKVIMKGWSTSQSALLEAYRKTFLNIDQMIIRELSTDFMGIF